jgi:hypothetical protein
MARKIKTLPKARRASARELTGAPSTSCTRVYRMRRDE